MKLFSERMGIRPSKTAIQIDSMDSDLRKGLWNVLKIHYWDSVTVDFIGGDWRIVQLLERLWDLYFKRSLDDLDHYWKKTYVELRNYFYRCDWHDAYSFIEFVVQNYPYEISRDNRGELEYIIYESFIINCNDVLKRELSGYRFVEIHRHECIFTQITDESEIRELVEASGLVGHLSPVSLHLRTSFGLFSDRKSPDYRNSIKESISAVGALCNIISGKNNKGLGSALDEIERTKKVSVHNALKEGFKKIYGWTSDADGIRHPMMEMSKVDFEDAKFMLVSCSAFINYLKEKAIKAGIKNE